MTILDINIDQLTINPSAQRQLNLAYARKMAKGFDPNLLGVIHVCRSEDGKYNVIDGQHRVFAARLAEYGEYLACEVQEAMTDAEQADRFLSLNNTLQVQTYDKFRMRVTRGDYDALTVHGALTEAGYSVGHGDYQITATTACEKIVSERGARALTEGLKVISQSFGNDKSSVQGVFLRAVCEVVGREGVDRKKLIKALSGTTPSILRQVANAERGREPDLSVTDSIKNAILMAYQAA